MKIVKKVINCVIAFLLCLLIIANFSIVLLSNTILQENYIFQKLEENGYYEKIASDLQNEFENYQYQSGLPAEVFEGIYEEAILQDNIASVINGIYTGTEIKLNSEEVQAKLDTNIRKYLATNNRVLNHQEEQNITDFENILVKAYENKINILQNYDDNIAEIVTKIKLVEALAKKIVLVGLVVVLLITILLNLRNVQELVNTMGIAFLSSGIILWLVKEMVNKNIDIQNILLFDQSFSDFVKYIIFDVLEKFKVYGMIFAIIGLAGIVWSKCKVEDKLK